VNHVWRRILVPGNVTLEKLHYVIQVAMGWTNSYPHQFIVGQTYYGEPYPDYGLEMRDEKLVRLNRIAPGEGFLEAIRDPNHSEHEMYVEWIGGEFDPGAFDLGETN